MKDDIQYFRQICSVLFKEKGYSQKKVIDETNLSQPVITKLLNEDPIPEKGIRASTLAIVQDFNKKHAYILAYAGAEETAQKPEGKEEEKRPDQEKRSQELAPFTSDLVRLLKHLSTVIPGNVKLIITVNG